MSNGDSQATNDLRYHPAKLLALKMIAEFKMPRHILKELCRYVQEGIITSSWLEKQSSEVKRAKWCRPIVYKHRSQHLIEGGFEIALEQLDTEAEAQRHRLRSLNGATIS